MTEATNAGEALSETGARHITDLWTALWNGELPATEVVSETCRSQFGRAPRTDRATSATDPDGLQAIVDAIRGSAPDLVYRYPTPPIPGRDGLVTLLWDAESASAGLTVTGIDILRVVDTRIVEVRSVTGDHRLDPLVT